MSVGNKDIGCLTLDYFKEVQGTESLFFFFSLRVNPTTGLFDTLAAR